MQVILFTSQSLDTIIHTNTHRYMWWVYINVTYMTLQLKTGKLYIHIYIDLYIHVYVCVHVCVYIYIYKISFRPSLLKSSVYLKIVFINQSIIENHMLKFFTVILYLFFLKTSQYFLLYFDIILLGINPLNFVLLSSITYFV